MGAVIITIDFETRSKADLIKVGAHKYAECPSTDILCLAYDMDDGEGPKLWTKFDGARRPIDLWEAIDFGAEVEAHNASFELAIWNGPGAKRYGFPPLPVEQVFCSAASGAMLALPRALGELGVALESPVRKDEAGRDNMLRVSKPRKPTKKDPSVWYEDFDRFMRLFDYCKNDVATEKACANLMPKINKLERPVWLLDQKINQRGVRIDIELAETAIRFANRYAIELESRLKKLTGGLVETANQSVKLKEWLNDNGAYCTNVQADTIEELVKIKDTFKPEVAEVIEIRSLLASSSVSKYKKMLACACDDGRVRGTLLYHGATTGRWAGKGIQPQNFPRGKVSNVEQIVEAINLGDYDFFKTLYPGEVMKALSSAIRSAIIPADGHDFIAADFSQIEARVLMWLAECSHGLELFSSGGLIYEDMAARIYGRPINKDDNPAERNVGKHAVLGLGFGMGPAKFIETCWAQGRQVVDHDLAKLAVDTYRSVYVDVKQFWYRLEAAAKYTIKTGKTTQVGFLRFEMGPGYLFMRLPSGRRISYKSPSLVPKMRFGRPVEEIRFMGVDTYTKKWSRQSSYGGKLCENACQSIARDLMVKAMFNVERAGYPVVLTVHDEVLVEPRKDFGSIEEFTTLVKTKPTWAEGCPVDADSWRGPRYKKG